MVVLGHTKFLNAKSTCTLLFAAWLYTFLPYLNSLLNYQGLLILPLILVFIYIKKSSLNRARMVYSQYGLILLFSSTLAWLFSVAAGLELLSQVAMISVLISIIITTCGEKITHILLLPLLCLYLLLPVGADIFRIISQWFSISLVKALSAANLDVYWETQQIYFNNSIYDIHVYLSSFKYAMLFIGTGCGLALFRTKHLLSFFAIAISFVVMPLLSLWLTMFSFILFNNIWQPIILTQSSCIIIGWGCTAIGLLHAIVLSKFLGERSSLLWSSEDIDWHARRVVNNFSWLFPFLTASTIILMASMGQKHILRFITW